MSCPICYCQVEDATVTECCLNSFCRGCLAHWNSLKSTCPICNAQIGEKRVNMLGEKGGQFDNGSLMFQGQLLLAEEKMIYFQEVLRGRQQRSNHLKSGHPYAHIKYLQQQVEQIEEGYSIARGALESNDRTTTAQYLQIITELVMSTEAVLDGRIYMGESCMEDCYMEESYTLEDQDEEEKYKKVTPRKKARRVK